MAKKQKKNDPLMDFVKILRKIHRENELARQKIVGQPRSKSWGGSPSAKEARRIAKRNLRKSED